MPLKRCQYCDAVLVRRDIESASAFATRETCGHRCAARRRVQATAVLSVADEAQFIALWNALSDAGSVGAAFGLDRERARRAAAVLRGRGIQMKQMPRGLKSPIIVVHGVSLSVKEAASIVGVSSAAILYRVAHGMSALGPRDVRGRPRGKRA